MRAQQLAHHVVGRLVVEVEPEEVGTGQGGEDVLGACRHVGVALVQRPFEHVFSLPGPAATEVDIDLR